MDVSEIIANNIKTLRKAKGLSQIDVAEAIGIDASVYSRIETGHVMTSHDKLQNLAKLYQVPIEIFKFAVVSLKMINSKSPLAQNMVAGPLEYGFYFLPFGDFLKGQPLF